MAQQPQANNCNSVVIITEQPKFNSNETQETQKWGTVIESIIDNVSLISMDSLFLFCILEKIMIHIPRISFLSLLPLMRIYTSRGHIKRETLNRFFSVFILFPSFHIPVEQWR